jgi:hypothetical protein
VSLHASLFGGRVGAAKRSAVSTGRLKRLPALYVRPIDLVVFQEPVQPEAAGDLFWRRVSRLDAFSVYPGRTLATQRCPERDNWHTRGASLPVLSY